MRWSSLARKLAVSAVSLIVVSCAAELAARWAEPGPMSLWDSQPYLRRAGLSHVHLPGFRGRWDGTWYEINSRGWRGPPYEPGFGEGEYRVVALGDSCTFGKGVRESDSWPRRFERMLSEELGPGQRALVGNLGVNGYSSRNYLQAFREQAAAVRPHLVVLGYNLNDFPNIVQRVDRAVYQGRQNLRAKLPGGLRDGLGRFAMCRWLRATYYEFYRERDWQNVEAVASSASEANPGGEERFRQEGEVLRELVREADAVGAKVVVFLFPYESMVYLESFSVDAVERVRALAADLGVAFVDLTGPFRAAARETEPPRRLFLRGDRYHPNATGYEIVAQSVLDSVREHGWLPPAR